VHQAQAEISSAEFTEWMAYYKLEPFGDTVADLRHGTACALLANVNRDPKANPDPFNADDFIYWSASAQEPEEPLFLTDPVAQSNLIRAAIFGIAPPQPE
jgi:hypothetical protein